MARTPERGNAPGYGVAAERARAVMRRTGIDVVGDAPWGTHFCQFYATKEDLTDILVPYFEAGLESNESCMWVTSPPLDAEEAWSALARAVPDLDAYRRRGRIEILPHTEWYLRGGKFEQDRVLNGWVSKLEEALARGCDGLRLSGNTFWLEKSDWRSFAEYEAAVDGVLGQYRVLALCTYSLERCGASEVADVIRNHQFALIKRDGRWEMFESFDRRRMQEGARKAIEEKRYVRSLLEASLDPMVAISRDGKITDVNEATEKATGTNRVELIGTDFARYFTRPREAEGVYRRVLAEGYVRDYPLTLRDRAGRTIDVLYNANAYRDDAGELRGVFASARDVTERKRAEDEIRRLNAELERRVVERTAELESAYHELEAFAYSVSHDLRAPLRAIDGFSRMLVESHRARLDPEGVRLLDVVRDSAVRMGRLIDDILAFSRMGRVGMSTANVDMKALVRAVFDELRPAAGDRDIALELGELPAARGDPAMLRQVVVNLVGNAIKFTRPRARAVIAVEGRREGREVVYSVRDNGVGFDMRYASKLFGVFQRLQHAEEFEGTGIGLAIVKRIVSRHGGSVSAVSRPGEGATFRFSLPPAGAAEGG